MRNSETKDKRKQLRCRGAISLCFMLLLMCITLRRSIADLLQIPGLAFLAQVMDGPENAVTLAFIQFVLLLPILYVNRDYYEKGLHNLFHWKSTMESLVAIGTGSSVFYGIFTIMRMSYELGRLNYQEVARCADDLYFEAAALILTILSLGLLLEEESGARSSQAVAGLQKLSPETVIVKRNGEKIEIPVEELRKGQIFYLEPGMRVPADGMIVRGQSAMDESAITGESLPVEKIPGSRVVTATINLTGSIACQAEKIGEETTLAQIIRLVEQAGKSKAPIANLGDKIAGVFVPLVIAIAALTFLSWIVAGSAVTQAMEMAIEVLVISCPCALGLATPLATMMGTSIGVENGIFIKVGQALQQAKDIDTVVLDKTGTITEGKTKITDIILFDKAYDRTKLIALAASLQSCEEHLYSIALKEAAEELGCEIEKMTEFQSVYGKGISGRRVNQEKILLGNAELMEMNDIFLDEEHNKCLQDLMQEGRNPLILAVNDKIVGVITISDVIKSTSYVAVQKMKKMGLKVVMLTGDNETEANAVGKRLGLRKVVAQVLPAEKEREITRLKKEGRKVAMIGDGINDAPALASADIGIAIGAGADIAIESADIVLMHDDLQDAVKAIRLSKAVIQNIKQNLFWAFFFPTLSIPVAAGVFYPILHIRLNPMFGALVMSLSSLFVLVNALRLKLFK